MFKAVLHPPAFWGRRGRVPYESFPLVQEVLVIVSGEVILSSGLSSKRLTITDLLQVVEPARDTSVAV